MRVSSTDGRMNEQTTTTRGYGDDASDDAAARESGGVGVVECVHVLRVQWYRRKVAWLMFVALSPLSLSLF